MTTSIGLVTLNSDMVWSDEYKWSPLYASVQETLGGGRVIQEFSKPTEIGRVITLQTLDNQGYQNKSTVDALTALTAQPESIYVLTIISNSITLEKTVRLRNEVDGGAVQFEMSDNMNGLQKAGMKYSGSIYMECV